jgi:hypothetical protein
MGSVIGWSVLSDSLGVSIIVIYWCSYLLHGPFHCSHVFGLIICTRVYS